MFVSDSLVYELRTPDRHFSSRQSVGGHFICSFMQVVFANRQLVNSCPTITIFTSLPDRCCTPAEVLHRISLLSFVAARMLMKEYLKNLPFTLRLQRRSIIGVKFITSWLCFESTSKSVPNS
jgi:hypothetical protein